MAEFNKAVITQKGWALITKSTISKTAIDFTKIETGDGSYLETEDLSQRNSIINKKQEFPIASWEKEDDITVRLRTLIVNADLPTGYYIKEIGLFANDPDQGKILYAIITAVTDKWDFVPASSDFKLTISVDIYTTVSSAGKVSIFRSEESYALAEDLEELKDETREHLSNSGIHVSIVEKAKYLDKYTKIEIDNKLAAIETNIDWKEAVNTYADITTRYPNPQDGWTVNVKDTDYTYRWTGSEWVAISANAIPKATIEVDGLMVTTQVDKLEKIAVGAEVNQNAFSNVLVGSTTIAADSKTDTLTLAAGSNITLTPDAANDKVTIEATHLDSGVTAGSYALSTVNKQGHVTDGKAVLPIENGGTEGKTQAEAFTNIVSPGGAVAGRLKLERDYYVHSAAGTAGTAGYIHIAQIKIFGMWQDAPIELIISQRRMSYNTKILIKFASAENQDPALGSFTYEGQNNGIHLHKTATSTWDLYVYKTDNYDNISVVSLNIPNYSQTTSVAWKDSQVSMPPDGSTKATLATNITNITGTASNVTGVVDVKNGGTGATDAEKARTNLGAASTALATTTDDGLMSKDDKVKLDEIWKVIYPVGAIYMSVSPTSPQTLFGGTWEAWGSGKAVVGVDASDTDFNTVEKTGGSKTEALTASQMPSHTHAFTGNSNTTSSNSHTHAFTGSAVTSGTQSANHTHTYSGTTSTNGSHIHGNSTSSAFWSASSGYGNVNVGSTTNSNAAQTAGLESAGDHTHTYSGTSAGNSASHTHTVTAAGTNASTAHTHTVTPTGTNASTGGGSTHNNMQPFMTCYMWKRTA